MPNGLLTRFQNLEKIFSGDWSSQKSQSPLPQSDNIDKEIYKTDDRIDYERKKLELQQNEYLGRRWVKANVNLSVNAFAGLNNIRLMYRDVELMDSFPEIGSALDTYMEESCITSPKGNIINVFSKSDRVKSIIEDLLVNRLDIQTTAPMIVRGMCKYGNQFMLLNIDNKEGVKGWKQLPVFSIERMENGIRNPYGGANTQSQESDMGTQFIWTNENSDMIPFRNWQIGHFRLINNSLYLPYGVSVLNSARRHFRMLSLMEDMMLIYRLDRSIERRIYKVFVGGMNDADIEPFVQEFANKFKRASIIDPVTGQVDLRKNILPVHKDTPIPLMDGRTITIKELADEFESGKENFVYSIQDKTFKVVQGKVVWCGKSYTAEKLVKITLDDGSHMIMAPEHEIIMRDGSKKRADEVACGESVMPFYRKKLLDGIETIKTDFKISKIDVVDGDDVYCMTVVGMNGEDDRHNFALRTWKEDGEVNENGVFVSNCVDNDIFIPTRDLSQSAPIETLPAAQNLTAMDDIKYIQNKVLAGLRIPKTFLNFEENVGDGKNLALLDIRFTRTVNRIQQAFLMELNKIVSIHLYLLGFKDDLSNFMLTMNNPSTQAEQLEIENTQKKIQAVRDAVGDPGNGLQIMSLTRALKEIMNWSDKDIQNNLEEIRLERALASELEKTSQIIQKTGIFNRVDNMYGEPGAEYQTDQQGESGGDEGMQGGIGGGGAPIGGGDSSFGDGLDELGSVGADEEGELNGEEGSMPTEDVDSENEEPQQPPMESKRRKGKLLNEISYYDNIINQLKELEKNRLEESSENAMLDKTLKVNNEFEEMAKNIDKIIHS